MSGDILHPGPPPLTKRAAHDAIDVIDFMAAVVRGVDLIDVTPKVRKRWQRHVTDHYGMLPPNDRQFLAMGDQILAQIRQTWPSLNGQQREQYRQHWAQSLAPTLQFLQPVVDTGGTGIAPPSPQPQWGGPWGGAWGGGQQPGGFQTASSWSGGYGQGAGGYYDEIRASMEQNERRAYAEGGAPLAQQVSSQNQAATQQMLSNLSQMNYQSMMAVAKNFKY